MQLLQMSHLITVAPRQPFPISVFAYEEDTALILSTQARVQKLDDHPIRVMTALIEQPTIAPGSVLPRGGNPLRLFAVVHDLEHEPTTCDAWVESALNGVLSFCAEHRVVALGLDALGTVHARRCPGTFLHTLSGRLASTPLPSLRRVWLRAHMEQMQDG